MTKRRDSLIHHSLPRSYGLRAKARNIVHRVRHSLMGGAGGQGGYRNKLSMQSDFRHLSSVLCSLFSVLCPLSSVIL